jgi:L-alanine-DL-glutamate epimerase-like enolase superfamily enzyme
MLPSLQNGRGWFAASPVLKEAGILSRLLCRWTIGEVTRMAAHGVLGVGDLGLTHVDEFIEAMDRGGASICQPDISQVGGFTGLMKIARAPRQRGKRVITHGYKTNIIIAANLHFLANHWTPELLEYSTSKSPLRWETTEEQLPVGNDGKVGVPVTPGLGVRLKEETVRKYRV